MQEKVFLLMHTSKRLLLNFGFFSLNSLTKEENTDFWLKIFLKRILFSQAEKNKLILPAVAFAVLTRKRAAFASV
jgi:hypothetical protein